MQGRSSSRNYIAKAVSAMAEVDTPAKPTVLTAADPVSVLEHQLEKRGSFNPLEAPSFSTANVEGSLPTAATIRGSGASSRAQVRPDTQAGASERSDTLIEVRNTIEVPCENCARANPCILSFS